MCNFFQSNKYCETDGVHACYKFSAAINFHNLFKIYRESYNNKLKECINYIFKMHVVDVYQV